MTDCSPCAASVAKVFLHHSTFELYAAGFEVFCREISEYSDFSLVVDTEEYREISASFEFGFLAGLAGKDMMDGLDQDAGMTRTH